ncbi:type II secretion system protein N [Buttiauxella warmboldiae]|uniref:Type II secretion system protein N n=1 Tax=Buttiauxella warmboldiae TaxID=82993 RepID=A0A3N5DSM8_9ENTR|nr:type II secretion system protein N [Buttiauxella warmboldiae]RPH30131.1 type II secretion system protein N [Buttiauxella warmboldiae]
MKQGYLLLPLLLGYLLGLVLLLPARFVIAWLPTAPGISLEGIGGTLWQGQAQVLRLENQQVGPVSWQWRSRALLEGKVAAEVVLADPHKIHGRGHVGWNGEWSVDNATLRFPAAIFASLTALPAELNGEVNARLTHLRFTPQRCITAQADVRWKDGRVTIGAETLNTGDIHLQIKCASKRWLADIMQTSEQLSSKGQLWLNGQQRYRLQAEVTPGTDFPPALLMLLAQGTGHETQGRYTFETSGRW